MPVKPIVVKTTTVAETVVKATIEVAAVTVTTHCKDFRDPHNHSLLRSREPPVVKDLAA